MWHGAFSQAFSRENGCTTVKNPFEGYASPSLWFLQLWVIHEYYRDEGLHERDRILVHVSIHTCVLGSVWAFPASMPTSQLLNQRLCSQGLHCCPENMLARLKGYLSKREMWEGWATLVKWEGQLCLEEVWKLLWILYVGKSWRCLLV